MKRGSAPGQLRGAPAMVHGPFGNSTPARSDITTTVARISNPTAPLGWRIRRAIV